MESRKSGFAHAGSSDEPHFSPISRIEATDNLRSPSAAMNRWNATDGSSAAFLTPLNRSHRPVNRSRPRIGEKWGPGLHGRPMAIAERASPHVRGLSPHPVLGMIVGAGLLAAAGPPESCAQTVATERFLSSPLELVAPGRTLTVIVPSREAEIRHLGAGGSLDTSRFYRELVRRFAEQHFLDDRLGGGGALGRARSRPGRGAGATSSPPTSPSPSSARRRSPSPFPPIAPASTSWCARAIGSSP